MGRENPARVGGVVGDSYRTTPGPFFAHTLERRRHWLKSEEISFGSFECWKVISFGTFEISGKYQTATRHAQTRRRPFGGDGHGDLKGGRMSCLFCATWFWGMAQTLFVIVGSS